MAFNEELKAHTKVVERLQAQAEDNTFLVVTMEKWTVVKQKWMHINQQTRIWQWKLDSNLPGQLGHIGDWLYRAEEMVESEIHYVDKHEDTAANIKTKLDELKVWVLTGAFLSVDRVVAMVTPIATTNFHLLRMPLSMCRDSSKILSRSKESSTQSKGKPPMRGKSCREPRCRT